MLLVGLLIELHAKPSHGFEHLCTHPRRMLANAASKNNRIETLECCGERAKLALDPVNKIINRLLRFDAIRLFELAHVIGNARDPF